MATRTARNSGLSGLGGSLGLAVSAYMFMMAAAVVYGAYRLAAELGGDRAPAATFAFGGGGGAAAPTFGAPATAPTFGAASGPSAFGTPAPAPAAAAAGGFSLGATPGGTRNVRKYKRPTKK